MTYDNLEAHPLAANFRLMNEEERESLKASITKNGLLEPIRLYDGRILDGRNRYKAAQTLGLKLTAAHFRDFTGTWSEAEDFVFATNASRRQMKGKDLENLIKRILEKNPYESDRAIAKLCGTSHVTVAKYRRPPEDPELDRFTKAWDKLSSSRRARFVERYIAEIREAWKDEPSPKPA